MQRDCECKYKRKAAVVLSSQRWRTRVHLSHLHLRDSRASTLFVNTHTQNKIKQDFYATDDYNFTLKTKFQTEKCRLINCLLWNYQLKNIS